MTSWKSFKTQFCGGLLLGLASIHAAIAAPVVTIVSSPDPAVFASPVTLDILITGAVDLYAYQFTLNFDATFLQATGTSEGPFLPSGGSTFFDGGTIDNALGTISFAFDTLLAAVPGVTGNGVLEHITFRTVRTGNVALSFSDVLFLDSTFADLGAVGQGRNLRVVPEPATLALVGLSLVGFGAARRRKLS